MLVMTVLAGPMAATPVFGQAPVQLYPRTAPAVPPPSQEPARPVPQPVQPQPLQSQPAQPSQRDEVLAVVEGFYAALARGDGQQANEFLVPEKRNQGAFEIAAMTRFYSAMSEPLRVIGVGRPDPLVVRVQYAYAHQSGRRCDGVADVTVHRVGGRALIERIRALSGC
jgi:hypothetical protein